MPRPIKVLNSEYQDDFPEMAEKYCAEDGLTDKELCGIFDVTVSTIKNWMKKHPEFGEAVRRGRVVHVRNQMEDRLVARAMGYDYEEQDVVRDEEDNIIKTITKKKKMPPNMNALTFYLRKRDPERWGDKKEEPKQIEHKHTHSLDVSKADSETLMKLRELQGKILEEQDSAKVDKSEKCASGEE